MSDTRNAWMAVNEKKVDNTMRVLETLRMQNVDLYGLTTCQDIKQLIQSMKFEIEKLHRENLELKKVIE